MIQVTVESIACETAKSVPKNNSYSQNIISISNEL